MKQIQSAWMKVLSALLFPAEPLSASPAIHDNTSFYVFDAINMLMTQSSFLNQACRSNVQKCGQVDESRLTYWVEARWIDLPALAGVSVILSAQGKNLEVQQSPGLPFEN